MLAVRAASRRPAARKGLPMGVPGRRSRIKKKRVSGYLRRKSTRSGRKILKRRRQRGRRPTSF
jgi:ribosomal protein L34